MSAITFRLPDNKHERLKELAKSQNISLNKLLDELSTIALANFDTQNRFKARAKKGNIEEGLDILNKL